MLVLTLSWNSYYSFTNPLKLLLKNKLEDNELCHSFIHQLTTVFNENQFTAVGLSQTLNRFIAPRADIFAITHYNHAVTRYMADTPHEDVPSTNPQLIEKNLIRWDYTFHLDGTNKKYDNIIARALTNTKAYEPFFSTFNHFALTFHFLTPKEWDVHSSHEIMLKSKLNHTYTYSKLIQKHCINNSPARNPQPVTHNIVLWLSTPSTHYHFS